MIKRHEEKNGDKHIDMHTKTEQKRERKEMEKEKIRRDEWWKRYLQQTFINNDLSIWGEARILSI